MPVAYLCDFDGTIAPTDIGAALVRRFSVATPEAQRRRLRQWMGDELGHRELTEAESADLRLSAEDALAFVRAFRLDPGFEPFVREARGRGDAVMVVSEGFDFYIRELLERAGLGDLPRAANGAAFEEGGLRPEFPYAGEGCGRCGNCKAPHVRRYQALGYRAVFVGDGLSDRCGARAADEVMARGSLLRWCRETGLEALPFESFTDVADRARRLAAGAAPGRG